MGMDYIPVYEGEDTDDGSVKTVAGQDPAHRREIRAGRAARDPHDDPRARHHRSSTNGGFPSSQCAPKASS